MASRIKKREFPVKLCSGDFQVKKMCLCVWLKKGNLKKLSHFKQTFSRVQPWGFFSPTKHQNSFPLVAAVGKSPTEQETRQIKKRRVTAIKLNRQKYDADSIQAGNEDTEGSTECKRKTFCCGPRGSCTVWHINEASSLPSIVSARSCRFMRSHHQNERGKKVRTRELDKKSKTRRGTGQPRWDHRDVKPERGCRQRQTETKGSGETDTDSF